MSPFGLAFLVGVQGVVLATLAARLVGGRTRRPPERPMRDGPELARVGATVSVASAAEAPAAEPSVADVPGLTIVVACLNEVERIGPCLRGLRAQGAPVREILIVDSGSTDGTRALVEQAAAEGMDHVYLGFWIRESRKMAYKSRFRPIEALTPSGWTRLDEAEPTPADRG